MASTKIYSRHHVDITVGHRVVLGTEHPIRAIASGDHRSYISALLCNGICERVQEHRLLRIAKARANQLAQEWRPASHNERRAEVAAA